MADDSEKNSGQPGPKRRNPWAQPPGGDQNTGRGPFGTGPRGGGPEEPPDLDEMLRRAQANFRNVMPGALDNGNWVMLAVAAIFVLWLASGLFIVEPGENAVVQRFGAWSRTQVTPGLDYHFPAPIETLTKVKVNEIRLINIGYQTDGPRGGGRRDIPEESLILTADRNIVDLNLVIQWNIKSAEEYLFNIDDPENTVKKLAESAIREVAGQTDMFPIITNQRRQVADRAKDIIQKNLDAYQSGVNITQVLIEKAEVHPDVQGAFQDVQSAKQDAEDVQNRAGAYREDILPKARGAAIQIKQEAQAYKESAVAGAKGDAARFNAIYEAYLSGEDVTRQKMYLETMEDILSHAQKIVLSGGKDASPVLPYLPLRPLGHKGKLAMEDAPSPMGLADGADAAKTGQAEGMTP